MMDVQHTPGPWKLEHTSGGDGGGCCVVVDGMPPRNGIAYVQAQVDDPYNYARNANARLIAAAPELLAALLPMVQFAMIFHVDCPDRAAAVQAKIDAARAAIAKATGETL